MTGNEKAQPNRNRWQEAAGGELQILVLHSLYLSVAPIDGGMQWCALVRGAAEDPLWTEEKQFTYFATEEEAKQHCEETAKRLLCDDLVSLDSEVAKLQPPTEIPEQYHLLKANTQADHLALWWRPDASGYTTKLEEAGVYREQDALRYAGPDTVAVLVEHAYEQACTVVPVDSARRWFPPLPKQMRKPTRCAGCHLFIRRDAWLCSRCIKKGVQ